MFAPSDFSDRGTRAPAGKLLLLAVTLGLSAGLSACNPATQEIKQLRASCDDGDIVACNELGDRVLGGDRVLQDQARAAGLFQTVCDGGGAEGCDRLGRMFERATGVEQDLERAADLYEQACEGGAMDGCIHLGSQY